MPSTILFGFNTLLAVAIIGRAAQNRLLARFPAFFLYLSWMVVSGIYMAVVMSRFGLASEAYRSAWALTNQVTQVAELVVLLEALKRLGGLKAAVLGPLVGAALLLASMTAGELTDRFAVLSTAATGSALQVGAWAVLIHFLLFRRDIHVGPNLWGILCGLFVIFVLQWILYTAYVKELLGYDIFSPLDGLVTMAAYAIFLTSLWEPDQRPAVA